MAYLQIVRIVSLLPGATESLFALGLGDQVVGVTHECDWPPEAARLPRVTRSNLALDGLDGGGIEVAVNTAAARGEPLYGIDTDAIRALRPDLVISQDVCHVCAVPGDQVASELGGLPMLRQHPHSLEDVFRDIEALGAACGLRRTTLADRLRARVEAVRAATSGQARVAGVFLEWLDPPYRAGHWTPDLLQAAGIDDPFGSHGVPSVPITWEQVRAATPEVLILAPCGFDEARARAEAGRMASVIAPVGARRVIVFDGSAYFNRPGPRLADSAELLARSVRP